MQSQAVLSCLPATFLSTSLNFLRSVHVLRTDCDSRLALDAHLPTPEAISITLLPQGWIITTIDDGLCWKRFAVSLKESGLKEDSAKYNGLTGLWLDGYRSRDDINIHGLLHYMYHGMHASRVSRVSRTALVQIVTSRTMRTMSQTTISQ